MRLLCVDDDDEQAERKEKSAANESEKQITVCFASLAAASRFALCVAPTVLQ